MEEYMRHGSFLCAVKLEKEEAFELDIIPNGVMHKSVLLEYRHQTT